MIMYPCDPSQLYPMPSFQQVGHLSPSQMFVQPCQSPGFQGNYQSPSYGSPVWSSVQSLSPVPSPSSTSSRLRKFTCSLGARCVTNSSRPREYKKLSSDLSGSSIGKSDRSVEITDFSQPGPQPSSDAYGELRRASLAVEQPGLGSVFSEQDDEPMEIQLRVHSSAVKCVLYWDISELPAQFKYKQCIEVSDDYEAINASSFPSHITSYEFQTSPGKWYDVMLSVIDSDGKLAAKGHGSFKAIFSLDEIDRLMGKAIKALKKSKLHPFTCLYRCKPEKYWEDIHQNHGGIMVKYMKDDNGQAASPLNGEISGLFFAARTRRNGDLPMCSPFGGMRMHLPAFILLDPIKVNIYFCDYYCNNNLNHYVTLVVCEKGSSSDSFCRDRVRLLDVWDNPFLRIESFGNQEVPFEYFINNRIGVEIYYTEDVPIYLGQFSLPHNKSCLKCNLYPEAPIESENLSAVRKESTRRKRKAAEKCAVSSLSVKRSRIMDEESTSFHVIPRNTRNEAKVHRASAAQVFFKAWSLILGAIP
uniref:Phytanoyl-CoA hydroxylase-interacting protein-like C-terminal domain-containing protein n=1 Tax=Ditylenchus dipsaci TaxID=166011 RepID=A0A915EFN2_9BILA